MIKIGISVVVIAIVLIFFWIYIGSGISEKRREKEYQRYLEQRGRVVGSHTVECPECEEDAIMKVYQSGEEEVNCRHCGYED